MSRISTSLKTANHFQEWLSALLPFLHWRHHVTPKTLRQDLIAALTGAVVVLPQGVAFATIAGMPPEYGLYAGMIPAIIAALFGSSWHLVSGPTTAASVVLFSALSTLSEPGTPQYVQLALTLTFMVGLIQLAMGFIRLGALVDFISHTVIVGFTAGAALVIAASQLKHFLGIDLSGDHVYETLYAAGTHLGAINPYAVFVGATTLIGGLLAKRFLPQVPYMLAALVIGGLAYLGLDWVTGHATQVSTIGAMPATLPPLSVPDFSLEAFKALAPAAFAVTLFALTEAVSISRSLAIKSGQHIDSNQEFIGQGLSNIAGSFFSAYVATGSFNRSAINYAAGAKTPLAAVFAGGLLIPLVLLVAPLAAFLPKAAMAGILFLVAWSLIDFHQIYRIIKASNNDTIVLGATFGSALLFNLEFAILAGVILSLLMYLARTTRPRMYARVPDPRTPGRHFITDPTLAECPQLKIVRIDGSLFFGSVSHVQKMLRLFDRKAPEQRHLLLVASGINFIDYSGAEFLAQEAKQRKARGGALYLYRVKDSVCAFLKRGGFLDDIGEENVFRNKHEAISTIFSRLNRDICMRCDKRIFNECQSVPVLDAGPETITPALRHAAS